jgi:TrmH family RNA methyltransferase
LDIKKVKIERPFALILGNEGQGISALAKAASTPITIPMSARSESLNVAVAGSICMFEMKGQK